MKCIKFSLFFILATTICSFNFLLALQHYPGNVPISNQQLASSKHRILIICLNKNVGGAEIHALNLYKNLLKENISTHFLVAHNSLLKKDLIEQQLPFYACDSSRFYGKISSGHFSFQPGLEQAIREICKKHTISIIQCNQFREIITVRKASKDLSVKIVFTHHVPNQISPVIAQSIDGIIGVSPSITEMLEQQKNTHHFIYQKVICIPPFFDEDKFLNFVPTLSRKEFFQEAFNVQLKNNIPLICMIAHFYRNKIKNHELLLKALQALIYQKNKPVQVIFAGNGVRSACEQSVKEYKLDDYVHFLGSTQKTPELLFYSDINILPSKEEAFGIVTAEGALMKKPTIVSHKVGAANSIILHEKTGLIFESDNVESLVTMLENLLDNPSLGKELGENAYHHVCAHYSNQAKLKKLLAFYDKINKTSSQENN